MANATIKRQATGSTALLIIDVINDMNFEGAAPLLDAATGATDAILELRKAADAADIPVVYVNDNFGQWHSERKTLVEHCMRYGAPGRRLTQRLKPRRSDFFVIKPQFSGFYATNLPVLLPKLGVSRIILTGVAADICVLFTAADAHMREYALWVPSDAVAGIDPDRKAWALHIMKETMGAETRPTDKYSLREWLRR